MADTTIDLNALQAEIGQLSEEDLRNQLLEVRTKQRIQQKKYHNTDTQKAYRQKRAEQVKLMTERAKSAKATKPGFANLYEQIRAEAAERADQALGEQEALASDTSDV